MTDIQHRIYLGVPGKQYCWGTTTGVINSTAKHVVRPLNGGVGFSGVEDFNVLWTDALNLFEAGEITHFAMLHGDITPDPGQRWLDILLEIMDEKGAELVSAHSPIKDNRGLTSSGIGDPLDPWPGAYRRFTQREILESLPDVFNAEMVGYGDRPLLHNTGCWVADLRKDVFREVDEQGNMVSIFSFPERIRRDEDGKWIHQRESEDWEFSRSLWRRGARNTWITSRVRLTHHGAMDYPNWIKFGQYESGDENTAHRWRADLESRPLALVQILEFELGSKCNLGHEHKECPNLHPERYGTLDTSRELDDETIVACAVQAYRELGFTGLIGWIYYNEPLLQAERMFGLMDRIKQQAPQARFILWTNGYLIPEDCDAYKAFSQIVISNYGDKSRRGLANLFAKRIEARWMENAALDNRLQQLQLLGDTKPCLRPFVEFVIDNHGNTHLCCYDWQGKGTWGNVLVTEFVELARKWRAMLPEIAGEKMTDRAPEVCRTCAYRWGAYQQHDEAIVARARRFREALAKEPASTAAASLIMDESGCAVGESSPLVTP